jgi:quercetin dioxygenase-like cupin family protein
MAENIIIGKLKDKQGNVRDGTGVEIATSSPVFSILRAQQKLPTLFVNPVTKEIGAVIKTVDANGNTNYKGLCVLPAEGSGPPLHFHPNYLELFEVIEGSFDFYIKKEKKIINAGDKITVEKGTPHTFRPKGTGLAAFFVEAIPPGNLNAVIHTIFGLGIHGKLSAKGAPGFWQGIIIGKELAGDTVFVNPPPFIQKLIFRLLGNTAYKKGYRAVYDQYLQDDFWNQHVQQLHELPAFRDFQ